LDCSKIDDKRQLAAIMLETWLSYTDN